MTKICVTGGSGGTGHAVIEELLRHGHECVNLDMKMPREMLCPFVEVDMCDYKMVHAAMKGCEQLVHLAGHPHPDSDHWGAAKSFANNTVALHNAFNAAQAHGIKRVVWASSETVLGYPFETNSPKSVPLDETTELAPQNGYALSKALSEKLAELMADLYDMTFVGLRLSNVLYDDVDAIPSFQKIPEYWKDISHRKFNLWGYVDSRDAARAVRLGLNVNFNGAHVFHIAAKDTIMVQDSETLIETVFPGVDIHPAMKGRSAMLDCMKARIVLGWEPHYSWENVLNLSEAGVEVNS